MSQGWVEYIWVCFVSQRWVGVHMGVYCFSEMGWSTYGCILFLRDGLEYIWVCVVSQRWVGDVWVCVVSQRCVGVHMDVCAYNTIMMSVKSLKCCTGCNYLWGRLFWRHLTVTCVWAMWSLWTEDFFAWFIGIKIQGIHAREIRFVT